MPVPSARSAPSGYVPTLTGLRAFAALLVLALHATQNFPNPFTDSLGLVQSGYLGVDLFFILSGLIIAHVYGRDLVPVRAGNLRVFLWHRFIRLYPAHAAVLIALIVLIVMVRRLGIALNSDVGWNFRDLPWHFLLLHAWGFTETASWNAPSWSISTEWFAYLAFPMAAVAALALAQRMALAFAVMPLIALAVVFKAGGWTIEGAWTGPLALTRVECEFVCGMLIQRATASGAAAWLTGRIADWIALGGFFGFIVAASLRAPDYFLILLLATLILGLSQPGPAGQWLFARQWVVWTGEISYSIYLVHFPALLVLHHGAQKLFGTPAGAAGQAAAFLISIAVVIAAASVLFYVIENPMRRRLRNLCGSIVPVSDFALVPAHHRLGHRVGGGEIGLDVEQRRAVQAVEPDHR